MDGETALEYVRSRHGGGSEGTDFARSRRQQKVIEAIRSKVLSTSTLFDINKLIGLYDITKSSIDTDIPQTEFGAIFSLFQSAKGSKITSAVIDYGDAATGRPGLLVNPPISSNYNSGSVLLPRTGEGNYEEIQKYVNCEIISGDCTVSDKPTVTPKQ